MYTTTKVCDLFNVSRETIRNWSAEFSAYLSAGANPGPDRTRYYSDDDLKVMALIAQMKRQGMVYADIHLSLRAGQRGEIPQEAQALAATERGRLNQLQRHVGDLEAALTQTLEEKQKMAGQIELLKDQLEAAQQEIKQLNREIGRLEADH